LRPQASFTSLEALVARIRRDGELSELALEHAALARYNADGFLAPPPPTPAQ